MCYLNKKKHICPHNFKTKQSKRIGGTTLRSISPEASSEPLISERIRGWPSPPTSSVFKTKPIAIPAIQVFNGTPASNRAKQPPQTDAILIKKKKHWPKGANSRKLFNKKLLILK